MVSTEQGPSRDAGSGWRCVRGPCSWAIRANSIRASRFCGAKPVHVSPHLICCEFSVGVCCGWALCWKDKATCFAVSEVVEYRDDFSAIEFAGLHHTPLSHYAAGLVACNGPQAYDPHLHVVILLESLFSIPAPGLLLLWSWPTVGGDGSDCDLTCPEGIKQWSCRPL